MVGANKILTVSYGTFSCTLEGFDDSFTTMKAIAEYFRDLASDDRYFGAEPPTPDAEMLTRIAEREINRRVETRVDNQNVVLRAGIADDNAATDEPEPEPAADVPVAEAPAQKDVQEVPEEVAETAPVSPVLADVAEYEDDAGDAVATQQPIFSQVQEETPARPDQSSVAAKLSRIRAVVARNASALPEAGDTAEDAPAENLFAEPVQETDQIEDDIVAAEELVEAPVYEETYVGEEAADDAFFETTEVAPDGGDEDEVAYDTAEEESGEDAPEAEMADEAEDSVFGEEPAYQLSEDDVTSILDRVTVSDSEAFVEEDGETDPDPSLKSLVTEINGEFEPVETAEGEISDDAAELEDEGFDEVAEDTADGFAEFEDDETTLADDDAFDATVDEDEFEDGQSIPVATEEAVDEIAEEVAAAPAVEETAADDVSESREPSKRQHALQRARARVIKMRKSDLEEAVSSGELDDVVVRPVEQGDEQNENLVAGSQNDTDTSSPNGLTGQQEAELQDELARVDAESGIVATPPEEVTARAAPRAASPGRDILASESAEDEDSVNRLLEVTNSQLDNPESSRRRSAISHLRAAVAATVADRRVSPAGKSDAADDTDAYRADLASVVKADAAPGAGQSPEDEAEAGSRPPPLVLVSEQRIDKTQPTETPDAVPSATPAPVIPRRVHRASSAAVEIEETYEESYEEEVSYKSEISLSATFAEFAEEMGAVDLPDLLEAAAAYVTYQGGQPHFTRPQIMRNVADYTGQDDFNREDGLRGFGQLLRERRIVKIRRGQFAIADNTRFRPEGYED